jgi:hypothetical protein
VGPALGGEYFFADRFSLGAEIQVRYTSVDGRDQNPPIYEILPAITGSVVGGVTSPTVILPTPNVETSQSTLATRAAVIARFYLR